MKTTLFIFSHKNININKISQLKDLRFKDFLTPINKINYLSAKDSMSILK